ncbi:MAG: mechanosensitive ion channel family protein [Brevinema sp.]
MFSSILKLFSTQSTTNTLATNTTITNNILTNSYYHSFTEYALASDNLILHTLGEIFSTEPSVFIILLAGLGFCIVLLVRWFLHLGSRSKYSAKKQYTRAIRETIKFVFSAKTLLIIFLSAGMFLTGLLNAPPDIRRLIRIILLSALLFFLYQGVMRFIKIYFRTIEIFPRRKNSVKQRNIHLLAYRFCQSVWVIIFISFFLGLMGVQLSSILAGVGIAGIIATLALQDAFSHLVGGVSLMLDETYSVGDIIRLDTGTEGIITEIGFRSTRIRTWDEENVTVPNGALAKMTIINHSQPVERKRVVLFFNVDATTSSVDNATELFMKVLTDNSNIFVNPEPTIFLIDIKRDTLAFRVSFYVEDYGAKLRTTNEVMRATYTLFRENNVRFIATESVVHVSQRDVETK